MVLRAKQIRQVISRSYNWILFRLSCCRRVE